LNCETPPFPGTKNKMPTPVKPAVVTPDGRPFTVETFIQEETECEYRINTANKMIILLKKQIAKLMGEA